MKPRLLLLLLLVPPPSKPTPVTYILHKTTINPSKIVSTAIAATEKIIITTKHPLSNYILEELCAISAPDFYTMTTPPSPNICVSLKKAHLSSSLILIELAQDLRFIYGLSVAEIPSVNSLEKPFNLTSDCKMVVNLRKGDKINSQGIIAADISYTEGKPVIGVTLKEEHELCVQDNGLPLYCKDAVVGIFFYKGKTSSCCENECSSETGIEVIRLIGEEPNELLRKFIPAL